MIATANGRRSGRAAIRPRLTTALITLLGLTFASLVSGFPAAVFAAQTDASENFIDPRGDPFDIKLQVLTGGVWVVTRPEPERQPVMGNGVIIDNGDHIVVVDGSGSPLLADRLIERIKALTDLPVRTLIITHWHGDHHLGAYRFVEQWPDLEIIAHRFTRDAMQGAPMDYLAELQLTLPDQLAALKTIAEQGRMADGSPVPEVLRGDFSDLVNYDGLIIDELNASRVTPPTRMFTELLMLDYGSRLMELRFFGPGNTAGDAVLWLPGERILITGDTVVAPTPFGSGSYPRSWAGVLERFRGLQPRYLVPGHGPVQEDPAYLELLTETLAMIADQAEAAVAAGVDLETFKTAFDWQDYPAQFHHNEPRLRLRFEQWFEGPVLEAAFREASGQDNEPLIRD